jgi:orotate phosphoribosyltransferase
VTPEQVKTAFLENGALLEGHYLLSSGLHSPSYMQCALVLAEPGIAGQLGAALAAFAPKKPSLVISPAMGGLIIGQEVARALGVRHYFMERADGKLTLRRGFALKKGETFVVVEDVVTTGKSSQEVIDAAQGAGAQALGVLCVVDRTAGKSGLSVPLRGLLQMTIPTYKPEDCPLCKGGRPAVKPGSRPQPA